MRLRILITIVRWLAVVLILRVLFTILSVYPDYFPPNFNSLFLQGRETTFNGAYQVAFYVHIFTGPIVLINGLVLLSESIRRRFPMLHRMLGRIQLSVLLLLMIPSAMVMARHSFGGWPAGLSFVVLSALTVICAVVGFLNAIGRRFGQHRRWMLRCYVLICSALALRLISGIADLIGVSSPEGAYIVAAWSSWLLPLAACELFIRSQPHQPKGSPMTM